MAVTNLLPPEGADGFYHGTKEENLPPLPMDINKVERILVQMLQLTLVEYKWLRKRFAEVTDDDF